MKRKIFSVKTVPQIQLVKGCPTDWNGDGLNNDQGDYNHDGYTDQEDQDFFDGYMSGYIGDDDGYDPEDHSDAYNSGMHQGADDYSTDHNPELPSSQGPDILNDNFTGGYY